MSDEKVRCLIGAACLLLAGCASTPATTNISPTAEEPSTSSPPTALATHTPTTTPAPSPIFEQPEAQMQCGADITQMVYSPNNALLATVSSEAVYICNVEELTLQDTLSFEQPIAGGIAWSPDSTRLAIGLADGTVRVWYAAAGERQLAFDTGGEAISGITWLSDGGGLRIVSVYEYEMHIWDTSTGKKLSVAMHTSSFRAAWSSDGEQFLTLATPYIEVWSTATGQPLLSFDTPGTFSGPMAWSPDGTRLAGNFDIGTMIYDARTGEELFSIGTRTTTWSPDGKWLAGVAYADASSDTPTIRIWDALTGRDQAKIASSTGWITSVAWSFDGNSLASVTMDGLVSMWGLQGLALRAEPTPQQAALTENGPWYVFTAASIPNGTRYLWAVNALDGTGLAKLTHEPVRDFAVRPTDAGENSATIAFVTHSPASGQDTLRMVTLPDTEAKTIAVGGHSLAWSPDGHKLAFDQPGDGSSRSVYVYDVDTQTISHIADGMGYFLAMRWSPDGRYIAYEGYEVGGMGGPALSGVWAASADGTKEMVLIEPPEEYHFINPRWFKGWLSPAEILLSNYSDIRAVNLDTGESNLIYDEASDEAVFAREYDAWLLTYYPRTDMPLGLIHDGKKDEIPVKGIVRIWWSDTQELFLGITVEGDLYTISPFGEVTKTSLSAEQLDEYYVVESPDRTLWAWRPRDSLYRSAWIAEPMSNFVWETRPVFDVTWSSDSQRLILLCNDGIWMAERPDFVPVQIVSNVYIGNEFGNRLPWAGKWIP